LFAVVRLVSKGKKIKRKKKIKKRNRGALSEVTLSSTFKGVGHLESK
jgi:hypothetical protein